MLSEGGIFCNGSVLRIATDPLCGEQKDWRNKLQSCEQVATQLLNMPDRSDSQFDKLLATTINYLLLAQSAADVDTRLHAEEVRSLSLQ